MAKECNFKNRPKGRPVGYRKCPDGIYRLLAPSDSVEQRNLTVKIAEPVSAGKPVALSPKGTHILEKSEKRAGRPVGLRKGPDGLFRQLSPEEIQAELDMKAALRQAKLDSGIKKKRGRPFGWRKYRPESVSKFSNAIFNPVGHSPKVDATDSDDSEPSDSDLKAIENETKAFQLWQVKRVTSDDCSATIKHSICDTKAISEYIDINEQFIAIDPAKILSDSAFENFYSLIMHNAFFASNRNFIKKTREYWLVIDSYSNKLEFIFSSTLSGKPGQIPVLLDGRPNGDSVDCISGLIALFPIHKFSAEFLKSNSEISYKINNGYKYAAITNFANPASADSNSLMAFLILSNMATFTYGDVASVEDAPLDGDTDGDNDSIEDDEEEDTELVKSKSKKESYEDRDIDYDDWVDKPISFYTRRKNSLNTEFFPDTDCDVDNYSELTDGGYRAINHGLYDDNGFDNYNDS